MYITSMKKFYLILPFLLSVIGCSGRGKELKFSFAVPDTVRYKVLSQASSRTTTASSTTAHSTRIEMTVSYFVKEQLANGDKRLQFSYDDISYENSQADKHNTDSIIKELKSTPITVTMSPYGDIADATGYEQIPRFMAEDFNIFTLLLKALPVFPRSPVQPGAKWEREQEYPIENGLIKGRMLVYKRFTLIDSSVNENPFLSLVSTDISMRFDVPDNENFSIQRDGQEELGLNGRGEIRFDSDRGMVTDARAAVFGKMIIGLKHPITKESILTKVEIAQSIQVYEP